MMELSVILRSAGVVISLQSRFCIPMRRSDKTEEFRLLDFFFHTNTNKPGKLAGLSGEAVNQR